MSRRDVVRAVTVRSGMPQHVPHWGSGVWLGEQCDGCGCSTFEIEGQEGVRCVGDDDDGEGNEVIGCGAFYPFQWLPAERVHF